MVTLLTPRFIPFFLVVWIISNVSVVFFPVEILPTIFRYGYAMPFYNLSNATRTILFRTRNQCEPLSRLTSELWQFWHGFLVGLNFGVLLAWIAVSLITLPIFQTIVRKRQVRAWEREIQTEKMRSDDVTVAWCVCLLAC
jgi:hypothetical protein